MKKVVLLSLVFLMLAFGFFAFSGFVIQKDARGCLGEEVVLPIVMYHKILKSKRGRFTVSPAQLEADYQAFLAAGYTPVFMSEVIDWVDGRGSLPEKPIVITFDDGHYNNLYYGVPIAKKLGVKKMILPVTEFSKNHSESDIDHSNPNYSHLTWAQLKECVDSGFVEIGNHTHAMHKFKPRYGIAKMGGENICDYACALKRDIDESQRLIMEAGVARPTTFAYPFGKYSKESREILLDLGFRALLTCNEWTNKIKKGDPSSLHNLGRYNRDGAMSTEEIVRKLGQEPRL